VTSLVTLTQLRPSRARISQRLPSAALSLQDHTIEAVRGRLGDERAGQLVEFWLREGALDEVAARERLKDVVCVLLDRDGAVAGSNSVYRADVELLGGRPFWIHRSFLPRAPADAWPAMANHAFHVLEAEYRRTDGGPVGLCMLVEDAERLAQHPEALWLWPGSFYAGYLPDGRQLRARYFEGSVVGPPRPVIDFGTGVDHSYRIDVFDEQEAVDHAAVVDFWEREGAMSRAEAERRVSELLLVATHGGPEPVAVATAYVQHNVQLGMDLWYLRVFVAEAHRFSRAGWTMMMVARDHLQRRFMGGQDTRAGGIVLELENEGLMRRFDEAFWLPSEFAWIGENERRDHVRVHYFPGALAPPPPH
jgi:hypothetical protein